MATNHEVAGSNPAGQELHKSDTDRLPALGVVFVLGQGKLAEWPRAARERSLTWLQTE